MTGPEDRGKTQETRILNSGEPCLIAPFSCFDGCLFNHSIRRPCFNGSREVAATAVAFCGAFFCFSVLIAFHAGFLCVLGHRWETGENIVFFLFFFFLFFFLYLPSLCIDGWDGISCMACCDEYGYRRFEIGSTLPLLDFLYFLLRSCLSLTVHSSSL